jgi:hypothetical protein
VKAIPDRHPLGVWLALEIVMLAGIGIVMHYALMHARNDAVRAGSATARFALVRVPSAIAIVLAATLL